MESYVERYIRRLNDDAEAAYKHARLVESAFNLCESPLERQLLLAYLEIYPSIIETTTNPGEQDTHLFLDRDMGSRWVSFTPQIPLQIKGKRFRPDFLFMQMVEVPEQERVDAIKKVVVEIDGHDFHERTKEQARRDRSRDRYMLRHGFYVLRFTGSEVFRDAGAVAREIRNFVMPMGAAA